MLRKEQKQKEPINLSWMLNEMGEHPNQKQKQTKNEDNYYNIANEANTNKDMKKHKLYCKLFSSQGLI